MAGNRRLLCELTIHDGIVVYDLNGITRDSWDRLVITNPRETRRGNQKHGQKDALSFLGSRYKEPGLVCSQGERDDREFGSTTVSEDDGNTRRGSEHASGARAGIT